MTGVTRTIPNGHLVLLRVVDDRQEECGERAEQRMVGAWQLVHQDLQGKDLVGLVVDF
jgi:hypothetical protein